MMPRRPDGRRAPRMMRAPACAVCASKAAAQQQLVILTRSFAAAAKHVENARHDDPARKCAGAGWGHARWAGCGAPCGGGRSAAAPHAGGRFGCVVACVRARGGLRRPMRPWGGLRSAAAPHVSAGGVALENLRFLAGFDGLRLLHGRTASALIDTLFVSPVQSGASIRLALRLLPQARNNNP